jgi:hypothetical protein
MTSQDYSPTEQELADLQAEVQAIREREARCTVLPDGTIVEELTDEEAQWDKTNEQLEQESEREATK